MIREARLRLRLSQQKMALILSVSGRTVLKWEKGYQSVSAPARERVETAARMQTVKELRAAMEKINPKLLMIPAPDRPLNAEEQFFVQYLFEKNEKRIRDMAYRMIGRKGESEIGEMVSAVIEATARLVLSGRISRYLNPMTGELNRGFIRLMIKRRFSETSLLAHGLKKPEQIFLNQMREIERKWQARHGRMITPEEFAQEFHVTVLRAERLLKEFGLLSQARPVSFDVMEGRTGFPLARE